MSIIYREDRTRYSMQLLAEISKRLCQDGLLKIEDLYNLKESEVIDIIKKSRYNEIFSIWQNATKVKTSKDRPTGVYSVKINSKVRYINPLVNGERIYDICKLAKRMIDKNLAYDMSNYVYLDSNF